MKRLLGFVKNSIKVMWRRHHFLVPPKFWKRYFKSFKKKIKLMGKEEYINPFVAKEYDNWVNNKKNKSKEKKLEYNPLISFIIPVYNIEPEFLKDCLDSILNQTYKNFEICLADDCSTNKDTIETLKKYEKKDKRVKVVYRTENGHISKATNSALEISSGEYIALMDDDDIIVNNALYKVVEALNGDKNIDMLYSDEDKMDMQGNYCEPHFKPDFSIDSLFGGNYICHFTVLKRTLLDKIGLFKQEYVGAQDFDLFLRATEKAKKVYHIPEILYHWRKVPGSTADTVENKEYAIENGKKAVEAALKRRKLDAYVSVPIKCTQYVVHYNYKKEPLVSIILLDNKKRSIMNNLEEIYNKINYSNLEIVINYDKELNLDKYKTKSIIRVVNQDINELINKTKGEHILIISGKIKIVDSNLIKELVGYSMQKDIGVVGPKIYNYDNTIKSAGLILSNKNIYVNAFANYFSDSYGVYGRLLVPYNYSALSSNCIMFSRDKYDKIKGFDVKMNFDISNVDFCLKMLKKKYRNVLLSHTFIRQKDVNKKQLYEIEENDKDMLRRKWNLDDNTYYNKNISRNYPFMIEKEESYEK